MTTFRYFKESKAWDKVEASIDCPLGKHIDESQRFE